jgi:hypothetical protein
MMMMMMMMMMMASSGVSHHGPARLAARPASYDGWWHQPTEALVRMRHISQAGAGKRSLAV